MTWGPKDELDFVWDLKELSLQGETEALSAVARALDCLSSHSGSATC